MDDTKKKKLLRCSVVFRKLVYCFPHFTTAMSKIGGILVLLDLSAAFDTIDHQFFSHILEHSLGITDSTLALMKSYLDGRQ